MQGHPTKERKSTQTERQEGGKTHKAETRMTGQRSKNTPIGKKGRTANNRDRSIGATPSVFLTGALHGKEEEETNKETGGRSEGRWRNEDEGSKEEERIIKGEIEDTTGMEQQTRNTRERLIGETPGVFLPGRPMGENTCNRIEQIREGRQATVKTRKMARGGRRGTHLAKTT